MAYTVDLDTILLTTPWDCPDPDTFETVVKRQFSKQFADAEHAARCQTAWKQTLITPHFFAGNAEASHHYHLALLALSPDAQAWWAFEEAVNREFDDREGDGTPKQPAIPGWLPDWVHLY